MMAFHWAWNALLLSSQLVRLLKMVSPILRVNRTNGFFADYDLQVDYDPELEEPKYQFERR